MSSSFLKRILSIFLFGVAIFIMSACSPDSEDTVSSTETNMPSTLQTTDEVSAQSVLASMPDADFEGYEFKVWTSNWANPTLEIRQAPEDEMTGEAVNDALYTRDRLLEDKYNIKITYNIIDDVYQMRDAAVKSVMAGDNAFDMIVGDMINVTNSLAQTGSIVDFNTMPHVDLSKSWWSKYAIRDLTINGKFFFATGDITPRYIQSPYLLLFNKALFTDYGLEYPYQAVLEGKWTIDMLMSLLKGKTKDINSDGTLDASDFYGMASESTTAMSMLLGCGEKAVNVVDGNPVINLKSTAVASIIDKLASFLGSKDYCYIDPQYRSYEEGKIFKERRSLMVAQTATNVSLFRDMEDDFGILPIPKLSEEQESYYSYSQPWGTVAVCVPVTNENLERTGMIIEAMAGASKYTSTPAMYDVTLKTKFARDEYSKQMLDIICENSTYDFAGIFNWSGIFDIIVNSVYKGVSFASKYEAIAEKANAEVQKTVDSFASAGA